MYVHNDVTLLHLEINLICIILITFILYQLKNSIDKQYKRQLYKNVVCNILFTVIFDSIRLTSDLFKFKGSDLINTAFDFLYIAFCLITSFFIALYIVQTIGFSLKKKITVCMAFPAFIFIIINLILVITSRHDFSGNYYREGNTFIINTTAFSLYAVFSLIALIIALMNEANYKQRRTIKFHLLASLIPFLGILFSIITGLPGALPGLILAFILVYLDTQNRYIVRDGLTGLNTKVTIEGVYNNYINNVEDDAYLYLFIIDLIKFKQINEQFGRHTGDEALVFASKILLKSVAGKKLYLARLGSDDFIVLGKFEYEEEAEEFIKEVYENFKAHNAAGKHKYTLTPLVGYCTRESNESLQDFIDRTYEQLNDNKNGQSEE